MKEKFLEIKFNNEAYDLILFMNKILLEFQKAGYRLSLRQLYYQLVARDKIPNTVNSYKRIGKLVSPASLSMLVEEGILNYLDTELFDASTKQVHDKRALISAVAEKME